MRTRKALLAIAALVDELAIMITVVAEETSNSLVMLDPEIGRRYQATIEHGFAKSMARLTEVIKEFGDEAEGSV